MTGEPSKRRSYLITASTGIGAEVARILVRHAQDPRSVRLFLVGQDENVCRSLAQELRAPGADIEYLVGDLRDPEFAPAVVKNCVSAFDRLDALFNVAGISGRRFGDGPVHACTEDGWAVTLDANATTQFRMCREVVRRMLMQVVGENGHRGVILNMSSILALSAEPKHFDTVAYAASKGAILAMSHAMAACYAKDKIRVNAIAPGLVRTPMSARASEDPEIVSFMKTKQPLTEDSIPVQDVAASCVYLLTDASRAVTGQVLAVDAGWTFS